MVILDTNVLSALMRERPDELVVAWLDDQPRTSVWTTSITLLEIRFGLQLMAAGKRRSRIIELFDTIVTQQLEGRIASFDGSAAEHASMLMAARQKKGRPAELRDTMIAGIALARHATLSTRNSRHFDDVSIPIVNPWEP